MNINAFKNVCIGGCMVVFAVYMTVTIETHRLSVRENIGMVLAISGIAFSAYGLGQTCNGDQ